MKKFITTILAGLLVVAAGAMAQHLCKKHLRSRYAPLIKATLPPSHHEERAVNIHDVRVPVPTEKGQVSVAKLETIVAACPEPGAIAQQETFAWTSSNNKAMEEVLSQRQGKALHMQEGCTPMAEASTP
jgi:hypothetical protein